VLAEQVVESRPREAGDGQGALEASLAAGDEALKVRGLNFLHCQFPDCAQGEQFAFWSCERSEGERGVRAFDVCKAVVRLVLRGIATQPPVHMGRV